MKEDTEFEDWSHSAPRLRTLDQPKHQLRLIAAGFAILALLCAAYAWLPR